MARSAALCGDATLVSRPVASFKRTSRAVLESGES